MRRIIIAYEWRWCREYDVTGIARVDRGGGLRAEHAADGQDELPATAENAIDDVIRYEDIRYGIRGRACRLLARRQFDVEIFVICAHRERRRPTGQCDRIEMDLDRAIDIARLRALRRDDRERRGRSGRCHDRTRHDQRILEVHVDHRRGPSRTRIDLIVEDE